MLDQEKAREIMRRLDPKLNIFEMSPRIMREAVAECERYFPSEFEVWRGDEMCASASGPRETALREAMHYAARYAQDGPVRVFEVTRTLVTPNVRANLETPDDH